MAYLGTIDVAPGFYLLSIFVLFDFMVFLIIVLYFICFIFVSSLSMFPHRKEAQKLSKYCELSHVSDGSVYHVLNTKYRLCIFYQLLAKEEKEESGGTLKKVPATRNKLF